MRNQKPSDYPTPKPPGALRLFGLFGVLLCVLPFSKGLANHTDTLFFGPGGAANLFGFEYNDKTTNPGSIPPDGTWDSVSGLGTNPAPFLGDKGASKSNILRQVYQIDTTNFGADYGGHQLTGINFNTVLYKAVGAMIPSDLEVYYLSGLAAAPDINSLGSANDWDLSALGTATLAGAASGPLTSLDTFIVGGITPYTPTPAEITAATVSISLNSQLAAMQNDITAGNRLTFVIGTSVDPYSVLNDGSRDVFEYSAYGGATGTFGDILNANSLRFELTFADGTTTGGTTTGGTTTGGTTTGGTTTGGTTTGGTTTGGTTTGGGGAGGGAGGVVPEPRIAFLLLMGLVAMQLKRRRPRASA